MKWINKGHQYDEYGKWFSQRNRIYIYGAAYAGEQVYKHLENLQLSEIVDGFVDMNEKKQAEGFLGKPVYSPDILFEHYEKNHMIIPAFNEKKNEDMIMDRLIRAGYIEGKDCFRIDRFCTNLNDIFLPVLAMYSMNKMYISSLCCIPSTKCNLKCKDCLNFTTHLPKFTERKVEDVCKDMDILFRWIDYTARFQISGGEPLLYSKFAELATYIGEKYRDKIDVYETVLNGTVVPSEEICQIMAKYDMTVYLDNYTSQIPDKLNKQKEIIERLEEYNVRWIDNTVDEWFSLNVLETDNSAMKNSELEEYFDSCNNPWHYYENGKMYACNFAAFAIKAGLAEEREDEYFDLNSMDESKRMEFLEFTLNYSKKGYVEFCKRCAGWCSINKCKVPVAVQAD